MRKVFLCALLLITLVVSSFALTSCHGTKGYDAFELPEEFDTSKSYEVVFWAKNEKNIKQTKVYQQLIEDFEKIYPNINVTMKLYSDYKVIYRDVITNIATKTTPNVCITYPDHIATYMTGMNTVLPLDEIMEDEKYGLGGSEIKFDAPTSNEVVKKFLDEGKINGVQYALPFMRSTEALYFNKSYVEKLGYDISEPITWDDIWEISKAALETDENGNNILSGDKKMIPFVYKSTDNMMIQLLRQHNGEYSDANGTIKIFNDTTKEILYEISENTESGAFNTFANVSYPADLLNRGQCVFAIDSTAGSVWMGREGPLSTVELAEAIEFELGVTAIPQADPDNPQMISQGPSVCIFNKEDSGEVLASWIFTQYLLTNSVQIAYSQTEGYIPVTTKAHESDEYKDYLSKKGQLDSEGDNYLYYEPKIEATELLLNNIDNTFITPVFNGSASLRMAAGEMIEIVVDANISKPPVKVDDNFINNTYSKVVSLYHLNGMGTNAGGTERELSRFIIVVFSVLGAVWCLIVAFFVIKLIKEKRKSRQNVNISLDKH